MKRGDYYSDRKMRDVFGVTGIALLVVKAGQTQSWLEDVRFCISRDQLKMERDAHPTRKEEWLS